MFVHMLSHITYILRKLCTPDFSANIVFFSVNKDYGSASIDYFSATMSLMILSLSVLIRQENDLSR